MASMSDFGIGELTWRYPEREGQPFVLRDDGTEVGCLHFRERPQGKSTGEFGGKTWAFEYSADLHPRVTIFDADSQALAEYVPSLAGGGVVSFHSGVRYRWRRANVWGTKWCFCHPEQKSSVCVSQETGALTAGGKVAVCCGSSGLVETPVLLLLAWFLRILQFEMLTEGNSRIG